MPPPAPSAPALHSSSPFTPRAWTLLALILLITFITFSRSLSCGFIDIDDGLYVTENAHVVTGFSPANTAWAFSSFEGSSWMPLTWTTLQLDAALSPHPPNAPPSAFLFHLQNILWHAGAVILLFTFLLRTTRRLGATALLTLLWAIHPLRVESVVWIAERKDVLALFWGLAALHCYLSFTRTRRPLPYAALVICFLLSLAGKPMLVTLPFLLLILDVWPLHRLTSRPFLRPTLRSAILEKIPLLAISLVFIFLAIAAQGSAVASLDNVPLPLRLENAFVSLARYILLQFDCYNLGVYYVYHGRSSPLVLIATTLLLAALTALALHQRRRRPHLLAGWLWYLLTLAPVIGIIQIGQQSHADRYTYLPSLGLFIMLFFSLPPTAFTRPFPRAALLSITALLTLTLSLLTLRQTSFWQNKYTIYQHTLDVTTDNYFIHSGLAFAYYTDHNLPAARDELEKTVAIYPQFAHAQAALGLIYLQQNQPAVALPHLRAALENQPPDPQTLNLYGAALAETGHLPEAAEAFSAILRIDPFNQQAAQNLARVRNQLHPAPTTSAPAN